MYTNIKKKKTPLISRNTLVYSSQKLIYIDVEIGYLGWLEFKKVLFSNFLKDIYTNGFYIYRWKLIKNKVYKSSRFLSEFHPLNIPASHKKKKKKNEKIDY